ncbi:hypothetical protein 278BB001_68 [Bacillus phage 278BB001]|nr:hypothetical protein 010DV004_80 [Bacillus phage 010DV004]QZA69297.1 hypothetical protein 010DV005_80 [Bacillus phage 010DV005]QZA70219.1 hypothetical protein 278BB001_68 [Bacillus phage 278BB001]
MRKTTKIQLIYTVALIVAALLFHVIYYLVTGTVKENAVVPNIVTIVTYYFAIGIGLSEGRTIGYNECRDKYIEMGRVPWKK